MAVILLWLTPTKMNNIFYTLKFNTYIYDGMSNEKMGYVFMIDEQVSGV